MNLAAVCPRASLSSLQRTFRGHFEGLVDLQLGAGGLIEALDYLAAECNGRRRDTGGAFAGRRLFEQQAADITLVACRETGSIAPKIGVELEMASGICREAAAMLTQPQGLILPSDGTRMSLARRVPCSAADGPGGAAGAAEARYGALRERRRKNASSCVFMVLC